MSKIVGVTVGTPLNPAAIEEKLKPVKTVNGIAPDESGNVVVENKTVTSKPGFYVGTEEPTDPDVVLWVNPDGGGTEYPWDEIGKDNKWELLDTFNTASGAVSYNADTSGCTELLVVTTEPITGSGQGVSWKGAELSGCFILAKGSVLRMDYAGGGVIAWQGRRANSSTDFLLKGDIATGAVSTNNDLNIKFSSVSTGTIEVWGR